MNGHILLAVLIGVVPLVAAIFLARRITSKMPNLGDPETFARMLLAEIRLYDRRAVDQASLQSAVYRMLKSDIDRARGMFLSRFPNSEPVFYRALVAILARGDADRIGTDYPYPRSGAALPGTTRAEGREHPPSN